jgi:hypothetical protein
MNILIIIIFIIIVYVIYITNIKTNDLNKSTEILNTDSKLIENITNTENITNMVDGNLIKNITNTIDGKLIVNNIQNQQKKNLNSLEKLDYNNNTFNLIGIALNKYYNQKYYLYESKNDQYGDLLMRDNLEYLNEQIYSYILAQTLFLVLAHF